MEKKTVVGIILLAAAVIVCGAVVVMSASAGAQPAVLPASEPASTVSEVSSVLSTLPAVSVSNAGVESQTTGAAVTASAVTSSKTSSVSSSKTSSVTSSKTSSVSSSKTSSVTSSKTSSVTSSKTSSVTSSKTSSVASSKTSSVTSSKTSSVSSSKTSSVSSSKTSSAISSKTSSAAAASSKTLSDVFSERIEIFNDPTAFAQVMYDYSNPYWSDGFMKYLISYANTLEYTPPADNNSAYTPTATQAERIAMLKSDTVTVRVGGASRTVSYYEALKLILANELSYGYHEDTLKAQLVCAYTFLRYHAGCGRAPTVGFASQLVQDTRWGSAGMAQIERLIAEVGGLLVTVDGHPAFTTYGALSNGKTNTVKDAWGGSGIDDYGTPYNNYMPSVSSPWCTKVKKYETTPTFPASQVKSLLESQFGITLSDNKANWIKVLDYNAAGYGMDTVIDGQKKTTAKALRDNVFTLSNVGYNLMLRSFSYTVTYLPDTDEFRFVVHGYGHGVGLSQYGAEEMAKEGKTWQQIIKTYFPGVTVPAQ